MYLKKKLQEMLYEDDEGDPLPYGTSQTSDHGIMDSIQELPPI